jgi:hypothetical protein
MAKPGGGAVAKRAVSLDLVAVLSGHRARVAAVSHSLGH